MALVCESWVKGKEETYAADERFNKVQGIRSTGVLFSGLSHELNVFEGILAIGVGSEVIVVMLQSEEGFPVGLGEGVGFSPEEKLHGHADGIREKVGVEAFEDFAFVFVVVAPCLGLAGLRAWLSVSTVWPRKKWGWWKRNGRWC